MGMKTILVPTEQREGMSSTLQTALLVARRFDSYMEGFALLPEISTFVAVDMVGASIAPELFKQESVEEAKKAKAMFESFMQERGVPHSGQAYPAFRSAGWTTPPRARAPSAATGGSSISS